jgi:hypothetical protein
MISRPVYKSFQLQSILTCIAQRWGQVLLNLLLLGLERTDESGWRQVAFVPHAIKIEAGEASGIRRQHDLFKNALLPQ